MLKMNVATIQRVLVAAPICLSVHWFARLLDPHVQYAFAHSAFMLISLVIAWQLSKFAIRIWQTTISCFEDKIVVITGCDSGFGLELALRLHRLGFVVVAGCLNIKSDGARRLQNLAKESRQAKHKTDRRGESTLHVLWLDVTSDQSVASAAEYVQTQLPNNTKLWALVNNAGIGHYAASNWNQDGLAELYGSSLEVNAIAMVRVSNHFLPQLMKTPNSRIVMMGSFAGRFSFTAMSAYCMSKHCVRVLANSMRRELKPLNVHVVHVEPTMYNTQITDHKICMANLDFHWNRTWNQNCPELHEKQLKQYRQIVEQVQSFMRTTSTQVHQVLDTIEDALCLKYPQPFYRVSSFIGLISMYLLEWVPEELQDFLLNGRIYTRLVKLLEVRKA